MPLSPEEQQQLRSLMEKAAASGEMPAFEGWTHLSVEAAANSGAMTDGSKRREDSYAEEPILKRVHVLGSSGSEADPSRLVSHAGYAAVEAFLHHLSLRAILSCLPMCPLSVNGVAQ